MSSVTAKITPESGSSLDIGASVSNVATLGVAWFAFLISLILSAAESSALPPSLETAITNSVGLGKSGETGNTGRSLCLSVGGTIGVTNIPLRSPQGDEVQVRVHSFVGSLDAGTVYPGQFFAGDVVSVVSADGSVESTAGASSLGARTARGEVLTVGSRVAGYMLLAAAATSVNVPASQTVLLSDSTSYEDGAAAISVVGFAALLGNEESFQANHVVLIDQAATLNLPLLAATIALGGDVIAFVETLAQQDSLIKAYPDLHINQVIPLQMCGAMPVVLGEGLLQRADVLNKDVQKRVDVYARNAAANGPSLGKSQPLQEPSATDRALSVFLPIVIAFASGASYLASPIATKAKSWILPFSSTNNDIQASIKRAFVAIEAKIRGKTLANFASISITPGTTGGTLVGRGVNHKAEHLTVSGINYAVLPHNSAVLHAVTPFLAPRAKVYSSDQFLLQDSDPNELVLTKALYQPLSLLSDTIDSADVLGLQAKNVQPFRAPLYEVVSQKLDIKKILDKTKGLKLLKTKPVDITVYGEKSRDMKDRAGLLMVNALSK